MIVLGIETSCDETSVAIVEKKENEKFGRVLSEITLSQIEKHKKFGGVVPELASREHSSSLNSIICKAITKSNISLNEIDAFSATLGPGLLGGLLIGSNYAKTNFNLNIYNETIENHLKKNIKYDLIIMADVIEHFKDPFKVLSQVNKLLNQNGKLIITTFNIDSLYAKITGKNYHWIIPFHMVFFSNKTLENFGKSNNLKLLKILNDPRYVSFGYLIEKLILIFPRLSFIFKFFFKIKFLRNINVKVDLKDLKIYYFVKM